MPAVARDRPPVLRPASRATLARARRAALRRASKQSVSYTRRCYRLSLPALQRLACFDACETSVIRLCKHFDRHGRMPGGESAMISTLIHLLSDTFSVRP